MSLQRAVRVAVVASMALYPATRLRSARVEAAGGSHSTWVVESSFGAGVTINDVAFADTLHGVAAGNGGALFVTGDGGQSWRAVVAGVADTLHHITFVDGARGYAIGDAALLRTDDGGATWSRLAAPSLPPGMQDLAAPPVGPLVLATQPAGATGGVFRSVDGGMSWQQTCTPPPGLGFDRAVFTSPASGWASGTAGLYRTGDGGQTWSAVDLHLASYEALDFLSPSFGYIGGMAETANGRWAAAILRTVDGGATWSTTSLRAVTSPDSAQVHALAFAADQQQGLAAVGSALYDTQDGGAAWTRHTVPRGDGGAVSVVGYRGEDPFVVAGGSFLHDGPVAASPSVTGTATPDAGAASTPTPLPLIQPTSAIQPAPATAVAFPSPTPGALIAFASPTAIPLTIAGIVPDSAVAASGARLTIRGTGFDALATVTIGAADITDVRLAGDGSLSFALPATVGPGVYTIIVAEPAGRRGALPRALTVQARLVLHADLLRPAVPRGAVAVVLAQATPGAQLSARLVDAHGRALAGVTVTSQRGPRGEWRILLALGRSAPLSSARILVLAQWQGQQARAVLPLRILPGTA